MQTMVYETSKGCDTLGNFSGAKCWRPLDLTAECPGVIEDTSPVFPVHQWASNFFSGTNSLLSHMRSF